MNILIGVLTTLSVGYGLCELFAFILEVLKKKKDGEKEC